MPIYLQINDNPRIEIVPTIFPDNTSQIWKIAEFDEMNSNDEVNVYWIFEEERELIWLCQLESLIFNNNPILIIPYLPYARQDKSVHNYNCFAGAVFTELFNSFFGDRWTIHLLDCHAEKSYQFLSEGFNIKNHVPFDKIKEIMRVNDYDVLLLPDEGAFNRYKKIDVMRSTHCVKVRNQLTGYIESISIPDIDFKDKKVLIVDDICDGGGTFIGISNQLKEKTNKIGLYVTHGIFSKGKEVLYDAGIDKIYSYDYEDFYLEVKGEH